MSNSRAHLPAQAKRTTRAIRAALVALESQHARRARNAQSCASYVDQVLGPAYRGTIDRSASLTTQLNKCRSSFTEPATLAVDALQTFNAKLIRMVAELMRQSAENVKAEERNRTESIQTTHALLGACTQLELAVEQSKNGVLLGLTTPAGMPDIGIALADPALLERASREAQALLAGAPGTGAGSFSMATKSHVDLLDPRTVPAHAECEGACWIHRGARTNFLTLSATPPGWAPATRVKPGPKTRRQTKPKDGKVNGT